MAETRYLFQEIFFYFYFALLTDQSERVSLLAVARPCNIEIIYRGPLLIFGSRWMVVYHPKLIKKKTVNIANRE